MTKIKSYSITQPSTTKARSTTTVKPKLMLTPDVSRATTERTLSPDSDKPMDSSVTTTLSPVEADDERTRDKKVENKIDEQPELVKVKSFTTCVTVNITEPTEPSVDGKSSSSTTTKPAVRSTEPTVSSSSTTMKSKIVEILKKSTTVPTTILPKDNSTETIEFSEKFSYSGTQLNSMDKNETTYDEMIVDSGVLPTEDEEEERRKDELESKQKIASFFGVDPVTGKEKDDAKSGFLSGRQTKPINQDGSDLMNKLVSNIDTNQKQQPQQSNRWFVSGNQQFGRDYPTATKSPKDDELNYHPMLRLLYRNCYGGCSTV